MNIRNIFLDYSNVEFFQPEGIREHEFLNKVEEIFPFLFKDNHLKFCYNNVLELIVKIIFNKLFINKIINKKKGLKDNNLTKYKLNRINIKFKLKIFLCPRLKNNDEILIDYDNIYLIVITPENKSKVRSAMLGIDNKIIYYKLQPLKFKKNNIISRRTRNIINKYLFKEIGIFIKNYYSDLNIMLEEQE